jgi:hypothetical protein
MAKNTYGQYLIELLEHDRRELESRPRLRAVA